MLKFGWLFFFQSRSLYETSLTLEASVEAYSETCQTSNMEIFAK